MNLIRRLVVELVVKRCSSHFRRRDKAREAVAPEGPEVANILLPFCNNLETPELQVPPPDRGSSPEPLLRHHTAVNKHICIAATFIGTRFGFVQAPPRIRNPETLIHHRPAGDKQL